MKREKLYISTTAEDDVSLAERYGLGLEIAEFCTAFNMDIYLNEYMPIVQAKLQRAERFTFHAAFNELCPAAIEPLVLEVTEKRYNQALDLASQLGIKKIVVHSGFVPLIYYKSWFTQRSIEFWRKLLGSRTETDITVCLENVIEDEPEMLTEIVREVDDSRFRLCLDVGHANCQSKLPISEWVNCMKPYLCHVHLHNNLGERDTHDTLDKGSVPMEEVIRLIERFCPKASFTIENMRAEASLDWLITSGILEG
ncbi:MAG: TIM barrel protein [Papillibacter sp.]|nr:TIM barrel protein [Papillibacter sp.]